ncbi:hypothetical protein EKO27_g8243 [Xylaria grammica]|uniref:NACHT domain-containing protein n=1 Tax=Xylaria grammica TaxID=363999 RepID=A0A439CXE4_9PEZI|nr:hypothetical protein EKO27_g8243 [Xylaria grammica]
MMEGPPSVEDFQIAIICALPVEADAITGIFDHFWEDDGEAPILIKKALWDNNVYTTGKVGQHNVVLAHMADYGVSNSAGVAANLRHTFPAVRVAFIVGVCGAAPKKDPDEILRGDIIIGTRIVEYRLGRQKTHAFEPINPKGSEQNTELRAYLKKMQGIREKWKLQEGTVKYLTAKCLTPVQIKPNYPGTDNDHLFVPTHRHKHHKEVGCETCNKCLGDNDAPCEASEKMDSDDAASSAVTAKTRQAPRIHFGAIGSADSVMKSSVKRDELAAAHDLLGFEMEGAGAWDKIPCFIIKGVCDYSDSHKNKDWQPYAAATAAACFKAFLVPWREVASDLRRVVMPAGPDPKTMKLLQDLFVVDPSVTRAEIETEKGRLMSRTGSWIFEPLPRAIGYDNADPHDLPTAYSAFNKWWTDDQSQVLWIRGDPGKGKTMLAMSLIDELDRRLKIRQQQSSDTYSLAYFFCNYMDDKRSHATYAVRSLLWQVLCEFPGLALPLRQQYEKQRAEYMLTATSPALHALLKALNRSLGRREFHGYFIVDALDECSEESRDILLDYLEHLMASDHGYNIKWLITVRNDVRLWKGALTVNLDECTKQVDDAVHQYVSEQVHRLMLEKDYDTELRASVEKQLCEKASGTFLWVSLACKELAKSKFKRISITRILQDLPRGLIPLYKRLLDQMLDDEDNPDLVAYAIRILQTTLVAARPLTFKELAVAADLPENCNDEDIQDYISICGSFLNVRKATNDVTLVHQSVKDYLSPRRCSGPQDCELVKMSYQRPEICDCKGKRLKPEMYPRPEQYPYYPYCIDSFPVEDSRIHTTMTKRCLKYLVAKVFPRVFKRRTPDDTQRLYFATSDISEFPMANYAILFWAIHGRAASHDLREDLNNIIMSNGFLQKWLKVFKQLRGDEAAFGRDPPSDTTLHIGCYTGISQLVEVILEDDPDINIADVSGYTGLYYAAQGGHKMVAELLLSRKAAVDSKGAFGRTALGVAVENGHETIVRLLLGASADVNTMNEFRRTPLHIVIDTMNVTIAMLLVTKGQGWKLVQPI